MALWQISSVCYCAVVKPAALLQEALSLYVCGGLSVQAG